MDTENKRNSFKGSLGFILAAAGSAVGLGNIWRFPYLAAKDGGGLFLLVYLVLVVTFGFALLTTEISIGRKTKQSPLTAYGNVKKNWGFLGILASLVPMIIMPYYCVIGGWVIKYFVAFLTGQGQAAAEDGYFTSFITGEVSPLIYLVVFLLISAFIVYRGVNKGIESSSKIIMPILLVMIIGISIFSLTISHTDAAGNVRTGIEGMKVYLIPNFDGVTLKSFFGIFIDALGQLFFSLSVAMGIMIAYGSYVRDDDNLVKSINRIELFDTSVAFLAGAMIIPSVFVFMGTEGMGQGPSLMFVSLPKVFMAMGPVGNILGCVFFGMVFFAAMTSAVSIMEAIVSSFIDQFSVSRTKASIIEGVIALVLGIVVCLGYNKWYFEITLPNGAKGQILDIMDYISNNCLMPIVAFLTCILIGWVVKPKYVTDEVEKGGNKFGRKWLYIIMVKFLAPLFLILLLANTLLP
ncbi:MAG: sodium-dependent transporter [Lachnospiraceae bacterium]|nr:sodium-dependent transporter [Lachnospiraceae bacterium]